MADVNTPVINPLLVSAIQKMKDNNSVENWNQTIDEVIRANFLCPVLMDPKPDSANSEGITILEKSMKISFPMISSTSNQHFFLAFTDWDELRKWQNVENQQTIILSFDDLTEMALKDGAGSDGIEINPFGGRLQLPRDLISHVKIEKDKQTSGGTSITVKKDTQVMLGEPKNYPTEMILAITACLRTKKCVNAAYLRLMNKEEEQSFLLIIDMLGNKDDVFPDVGKTAIPYLNGMFVDLVTLDSDFGKRAADQVEPFYKRKKFGWF